MAWPALILQECAGCKQKKKGPAPTCCGMPERCGSRGIRLRTTAVTSTLEEKPSRDSALMLLKLRMNMVGTIPSDATAAATCSGGQPKIPARWEKVSTMLNELLRSVIKAAAADRIGQEPHPQLGARVPAAAISPAEQNSTHRPSSTVVRRRALTSPLTLQWKQAHIHTLALVCAP